MLEADAKALPKRLQIRRHGRIQVHVLPVGLAAAPGMRRFVWWPDAPGNATCAAEEKMRLQGGVMLALPRPAQWFECRVATLSGVLDEHHLDRVDLLKASRNVVSGFPAALRQLPASPLV